MFNRVFWAVVVLQTAYVAFVLSGASTDLGFRYPWRSVIGYFLVAAIALCGQVVLRRGRRRRRR